MGKMIVAKGEKNLAIYAKDNVYRFGTKGLCLMNRAEYELLKIKYKSLEIHVDIPDPEPEKKVEPKIDKVTVTSKPKTTAKKGK